MYGRKRYPSMVWLLVQASIVFCYTNQAFCKPYRQKIHQEQETNNRENNKTILQLTNNPVEHPAHLNKDTLDPSLNSRGPLSDIDKDKLKTKADSSHLHESVIFKAVVSNINVLTLSENNNNNNNNNTNNVRLPKHFPKAGKPEHEDTNDSHSVNHRESKAHLKWDGHVVAAPLKYDPQVSNFQTPRKVSDTVSTSKMVLSLLTAAVALGSICLTVAIFQCCCRRKSSSEDEDEDHIIDEQCSKTKAGVKQVDTHEQAVEPESTDTPVKTPTGQTTTDGETVQKAIEEKEEDEQVSVKDKIKAFETHALKPLSPENVEHHRTLIKRPHSRPITESESESLSSSTSLIMGQVFRKRADTEKCQRKGTVSAVQKETKDDDYFGVIGRETEVLKSYRRAPAPRNRNKATKALHRKTMPNMDSTERSDMEITMSDWESTVHSFHQTESPLAKQDSKKKKKTPVPLPLPNQNAKDEVDNKLEDSSDKVEKSEAKTEETTMEAVSAASDMENRKSVESAENNIPDVTSSSSGDEASQGEETKIKEEMKEDESSKDEKEEVELKKEEEEEKKEEEEKNKEEDENKEEEEKKEVDEKEEKKIKKEKEEEEERLIKEEKAKLKKEAEEKEKKKLKEDERMKEEKKAKREAEELKKEKMNKEQEKKEKEREQKEREQKEKEEKEKKEKEKKEKEKEKEKKEKEKKEKEKEIQMKREKELKKEKELKREKDEIKREKEELNKEELKKGKEQFEKEAGKAENIFFQIDPTVEPTAAKLVKRDSSEHESTETSVHMRESKDDLPKNDESPKSKRHLAHLDRTTMFMLPGQKPEDHMSLMLSLKEKLNDKKEKNELDADTDTKMEVDPETETEKSEVPEC